MSPFRATWKGSDVGSVGRTLKPQVKAGYVRTVSDLSVCVFRLRWSFSSNKAMNMLLYICNTCLAVVTGHLRLNAWSWNLGMTWEWSAVIVTICICLFSLIMCPFIFFIYYFFAMPVLLWPRTRSCALVFKYRMNKVHVLGSDNPISGI